MRDRVEGRPGWMRRHRGVRRGPGRVLVWLLLWPAGGWPLWAARAAGTVPGKGGQAKQVCRQGAVEGEVVAGQAFERRIGNGLEFLLEPLASGWIARVLPAAGPRGEHDYAELATPPYKSVSPLLIGTDYSFRAQDAVGWNPREFRFATNAKEFGRLAAAYRQFEAAPGGQTEAKLAALVALAPEARLRIVDAHLVAGTADQARTAAAVASHFAATAHRLEAPADGRPSPLGKLTWMRFEADFELPPGFEPDRGLKVRKVLCR